MTQLDIRSALLAAGITCPVYIGGANYAKPTLAWLQGDFYAAFRAGLWNHDLDAWAVRWECRDFTRAYACEAQKANALTLKTPTGEDAVGVGEIWFRPGGLTVGHAINAAFPEQGLTFIDPQNNNVWQMSTVELASIYYVRF
jgi:hypothetical protein